VVHDQTMHITSPTLAAYGRRPHRVAGLVPTAPMSADRCWTASAWTAPSFGWLLGCSALACLSAASSAQASSAAAESSAVANTHCNFVVSANQRSVNDLLLDVVVHSGDAITALHITPRRAFSIRTVLLMSRRALSVFWRRLTVNGRVRLGKVFTIKWRLPLAPVGASREQISITVQLKLPTGMAFASALRGDSMTRQLNSSGVWRSGYPCLGRSTRWTSTYQRLEHWPL
jgi:hypothetical protein